MTSKTISRIILLSKLSLCAAVLMLISACGGQVTRKTIDPSDNPPPPLTTQPSAPTSITASQVFTPPTTTQFWRYFGANGCQTSITSYPVPATDYLQPGSFAWSYDKTGTLCYWNPGVSGAHLDFIFGPADPNDGGYYSVASLVTFPQSCSWCGGWTMLTVDVQPVGAHPRPYLYVPGTAWSDHTVVIDTDYYGYGQTDVLTLYSIIGPVLPPVTHWRNTISVKWIDPPPAASWPAGWAMANRQDEGPCFLADGTYFAAPQCNSEEAFFMPNYGFVLNRVYAIGAGPITDGRYDMWRVN